MDGLPKKLCLTNTATESVYKLNLSWFFFVKSPVKRLKKTLKVLSFNNGILFLFSKKCPHNTKRIFNG